MQESTTVAANDYQNQRSRQIFLVHLQIRKMAVTVYTSEEAANEDKPTVIDEKVAESQ